MKNIVNTLVLLLACCSSTTIMNHDDDNNNATDTIQNIDVTTSDGGVTINPNNSDIEEYDEYDSGSSSVIIGTLRDSGSYEPDSGTNNQFEPDSESLVRTEPVIDGGTTTIVSDSGDDIIEPPPPENPCGNNRVDDLETCDDGWANANNWSTVPHCNLDCTALAPHCGDETKDEPEFCDEGTANSSNWSQLPHCNNDCTGFAPYCGDGIKNGTEHCDGSPGCQSNCILKF